MCFTFDNEYLYFNPRGCEGFDPALKHDDVRIKAKSRFGPIHNYMALKPLPHFFPHFFSFGPIQNYMALKHLECPSACEVGFGPIQNYMALKQSAGG